MYCLGCNTDRVFKRGDSAKKLDSYLQSRILKAIISLSGKFVLSARL